MPKLRFQEENEKMPVPIVYDAPMSKRREEVVKVEKIPTKEQVLKFAKLYGLFVLNKSLSRYELNVPINDYEKI